MKKKYIIIVTLLLSVFACSKEGTLMYSQRAGIHFNTTEYSYTFADSPGVTEMTIKLPVTTTGDSVGYDREFVAIAILDDSLTTAETQMYTIGNGIVKAGRFSGTLDFTMKYTTEMDDSVYKVKLNILPTEDFEEVYLSKNDMVVSFSNTRIQPANWSYLTNFFGRAYSTAWWNFILEKTEMTSIPCFPGHPDKETWWMTFQEVQAYQVLVRIELEKYNATHDTPLTHDDGDYKGTPVSMP